jgi:hypothetical protein
MRTTIEIDDALMAEAQKVSGHPSKKQTVEQAAPFDDQAVAAAASPRSFRKISLAGRPRPESPRAGGQLIATQLVVWAKARANSVTCAVPTRSGLSI